MTARKRDLIALLLALAVFLALRGPDLFGPFVLPFETAFQEAIALHHLENGLVKNRFLPVLATIEGENFYHTAHPPLLHVMNALLYKLFGVREAVTRLSSLVLLLLSICLWRELMGRERRFGFALFPLALFLPSVFLLGTTTNYEPLSIFMISLLAFLGLARRAGARGLIPVLTIGLLVDWPVYLAVPALLIVEWRDPTRRRLYLGLMAWQAVFFLALIGYQFVVAGEAAFFSHAPVRANPVSLFSIAAWRELFSHHFELNGRPVGALALAAALYFVFGALRRFWSAPAGGSSPLDAAVVFFAVFNGLLLLSAFQLVSRHYVYLLYFAPLASLSLVGLVSRAASRPLALLGLLALMLPVDFMAAKHRQPAYFGMASSGLLPREVQVVFSSSAIGTWKFYAGLETMFPMSRASALWLAENAPDLLHLDLRHREVGRSAEVLVSRGHFYPLFFAVPGERVHVKLGLLHSGPSPHWARPLAVIGPSEGSDFREPVSTFILHGPEPVPAVRQHPGESGSALLKKTSARDLSLEVEPSLVHVFPFARSDGVTFMALIEYDKKEAAGSRLAYFRHLASSGRAAGGGRAVLDLAGAKKFSLVTLPGPRMNAAFDDAYWLAPILKSLRPDAEFTATPDLDPGSELK